MASQAAAEKWLVELTNLPTASGREEAVVAWVERWTRRRSDLKLTLDSGGNVLITQKGRKNMPPVLAVAHMDHPAFVADAVDGKTATYEFRGGVNPEYFENARVEVVSRDGGGGRVVNHDPATSKGEISVVGDVEPGDILMWRMRKPRRRTDIHAAPACDDLAGVAAALAALDRARGKTGLRHLGVLLTRAEEVGFVGALHAAIEGTIPADARILSIETSPTLPNAPIGAGPIIRTGDRITMFDREMTNRIGRAATASGTKVQRKLMDGGACEASAFGMYGYQATGLCLALGNHHNRGNLDALTRGEADPVPMLEEISISDFHGLVDLLLLAVPAVDRDDPAVALFHRLYEDGSHYLS